MKKIIQTASIVLLLLGITACGKSPDAPTSAEVMQDVEVLASNLFLGEAKGIDEKFPITTLIVEEMDIVWAKEKETLYAGITAFLGDQKWRSQVKQTITIHYELNASGQWEAQGIDVDNPVIGVIPRE